MTAKIYTFSFLPTLRQQVDCFDRYNAQLSQDIGKSYDTFLAFVDSKSLQHAGKPSHESLQRVYQFAADRLDKLQEVLAEEREDIQLLRKVFTKLESENNEAEFAELAQELIEQGDYKHNVSEFEQWIAKESAQLKKEVDDLLDDWHAGIEEDRIVELALLLDAIEQEEDEWQQEGGDAQLAQEKSCCSKDDFENEGCCGRQTPCCRSQDTDADA